MRYQDYEAAKTRKQNQGEIDRILEKISEKGIENISDKERAKLNEASSKMRRGS